MDDKSRAEIGKAIATARRALNLTQTEFAQALGASQGGVTRWERGVDNPPIPVLLLLADMVPESERDYWLNLAGVENKADSPGQDQVRLVRLLKDSAAAGTPRALDEREIAYKFEVPRRWLPGGGKIEAVMVEGDSMSPVLESGFIAFVDVAQNVKEKLINKMVLAREEDGVTIKWLRQQSGLYMLVPQNVSPRHPVRPMLKGSDFAIVGEVVRWIGAPPSTKGYR